MATKFETGKTYSYRFACNASRAWLMKAVKRTKCFVYFVEVYGNSLDATAVPKRRKVWFDSEGNEVVSLGSYSMAPSMWSTPVEESENLLV